MHSTAQPDGCSLGGSELRSYFCHLWTKVNQIKSACAGVSVVCNAVFRLTMSCCIPVIFAIKLRSCPKSHWNFDVFLKSRRIKNKEDLNYCGKMAKIVMQCITIFTICISRRSYTVHSIYCTKPETDFHQAITGRLTYLQMAYCSNCCIIWSDNVWNVHRLAFIYSQ